jgi:hypothetical protein
VIEGGCCVCGLTNASSYKAGTEGFGIYHCLSAVPEQLKGFAEAAHNGNAIVVDVSFLVELLLWVHGLARGKGLRARHGHT